MAFRYKKGGADALRVTTASRTANVWADGELLYDTDTDTLYVGDGSTAGGVVVGGGAESDTLQTVTDRGATTTTGIAANTGASTSNDFLFGRSTISSAKTRSIVWDQSKGAMSIGGTDPTKLTDFSFHGGEGDFVNTGTHAFIYGKSESGGTLEAGGIGSQVIGRALNGGKIETLYYAPGGVAGGYANYSARITAGGAGASALGRANTYAYMEATGAGSLVCGYVNYYGSLRALGFGARASGRVYRGYVGAPGDGSTAGGVALTYSQLYSIGKGSFVSGAAYGYGYMRAVGDGSFTVGYATYGGMRANAPGSICLGFASGATAYATGVGSVIMGHFNTGGASLSSGAGSFQLNAGSNAFDNSLKVGNGVHLFGTTSGAPSALANGMIWVNGGNVYVRTNGVTKNMSNI